MILYISILYLHYRLQWDVCHLKMASQFHFLSGELKVKAIKHCSFMHFFDYRQLHL